MIERQKIGIIMIVCGLAWVIARPEMTKNVTETFVISLIVAIGCAMFFFGGKNE